jgi:biotin carboxyl carrier protein
MLRPALARATPSGNEGRGVFRARSSVARFENRRRNPFNPRLEYGELTMRSTLKMPKVGDAVDEVVISEIQVQVGAKVAEGQTLFIVETDKTTVEVPAPFAGTVIEILIAKGDDVRTGAPTLVLEV